MTQIKSPISSMTFFLAILLIVLFMENLSAMAQGKRKASTHAAHQGRVYPEFASKYGVIHWIPEQMPLKVFVSRGACLDNYIDENLGAPVINMDNLAAWPPLVGKILQNPSEFNNLPITPEFSDNLYQAALAGINMWKPFEKEGLFSYTITNDPTEADIYVFWTHHFVNKLGLALFANDIRGVTSKESFSYKAIMSGQHADFKPVVILLRTTQSDGTIISFEKMRAAAAHEFGHALGIEGHSSNPNDLMSIYYGHGCLSVNDAATIRHLYHLVPDLMP
jgi:predicted Zn-dependent protease